MLTSYSSETLGSEIRKLATTVFISKERIYCVNCEINLKCYEIHFPITHLILTFQASCSKPIHSCTTYQWKYKNHALNPLTIYDQYIGHLIGCVCRRYSAFYRQNQEKPTRSFGKFATKWHAEKQTF